MTIEGERHGVSRPPVERLMDYQEARPLIKNGDFLFFKGRSAWGRLIEWWTRSEYSHVGVAHWVVSDGTERLAVCEALEGVGLVVNPLSAYLKAGEQIDWFPLVEESGIDRDRVVGFFMRAWGEPYSGFRQFIRSFIMPKWIYRWLGVPTVVNPNARFCSWMGTAAVLYARWKPDRDEAPFEPHTVSPGQLSRFTCFRRGGPLVWSHADAEAANEKTETIWERSYLGH